VELKVDEKRRVTHDMHPYRTGIYVRAKDGDKWVNADIGELERGSLKDWLRSRGGENEWTEQVVLILLGHEEGEEKC
jgi:hypothetical protein